MRPLRDMSGKAPFNEVYLDDVRIPADAVIGEVNAGWRAAVTMLGHERVSIGAARPSRSNALAYDALVALARRTGAAGTQRERLAEFYAHERALEQVNLRMRQQAAAGEPPGARGSVAKFAGALLARRAVETASELAGADAAAVLDLVADLAAVALAAEQVGGLERAMELTVDYAKVRVQFGRPIGSYQAVKHGCAEMYCAWEHAVAVLRHAAWTADHDRAALPLAAALAQTYIGPAYFQVATAMVQYHGGIGYTWEHDAHLYYKRQELAAAGYPGAAPSPAGGPAGSVEHTAAKGSR
ncbi:hypothetical protein PA7_43210 [Pseudonocardia asaccharolytica DSM 44247 = NBRC 16224]|uniref:Acyl-CoA dehydrogenase/oxidase C-terminal domain-containing protein n=2 Tax=Pseudonocardia asaccharolytica TaxID=54010 RepID=A0A511DA15_9PSEU|nr:hypothetical protein PA7_43210 [Pseudonocardia asaccharolytica DSM 44247 = NBRC 16224]